MIDPARRATGMSLVLLAATLLTASTHRPARADWTSVSVQSPTHVDGTSVAIAPDDSLLIAFGGDALRLATLRSGSWTFETADSSACGYMYPSLALSATGEPVVSYHDEVDGDLKLARRAVTGWRVELVDADGDVGAYSSLAFDPDDGQPSISYWDSDRDEIKLARRDAGSWLVGVVATSRTGHSALAFGPDGHPAVSLHNQALRLARWDGGAWSVERIDDGGEYNDLGFDPDGYPVISHHDPATETLRVARWDGGAWQLESVVDDGSYVTWDLYGTTIAFDQDGEPAIGFRRAWPDQDLLYARRSATDWVVEEVDTGLNAGHVPSLAFDSAGDAVISHYETRHGSLRLARRVAGSWSSETVESSPRVGFTAALGFGSDGHPIIGHYHEGAGHYQVRVAWSDGSTWAHHELAVGRHTSLAHDLGGNPAVAFTDVGLHLARWDGSWLIERDIAADAETPSLTFDAAGNPGMSYKDFLSDNIEVEVGSGGGWRHERIDFVWNWPNQSSLAFDASDRTVVAYRDTDGVKVAAWDGADRVRRLVAEAGAGPSMALDGDGNPVVAYLDATDSELRLASWDGADWVDELVTATAAGSTEPSLALDGRGYPAISYQDATLGGLAAARWDGSSWTTELVDFYGERHASLAIDGAGEPAIAYQVPCRGELRLARWSPPAEPNIYESTSPIDVVSLVNEVASGVTSPFELVPDPGPTLYYQADDGDGRPAIIRLVATPVGILFRF